MTLDLDLVWVVYVVVCLFVLQRHNVVITALHIELRNAARRARVLLAAHPEINLDATYTPLVRRAYIRMFCDVRKWKHADFFPAKDDE